LLVCASALTIGCLSAGSDDVTTPIDMAAPLTFDISGGFEGDLPFCTTCGQGCRVDAECGPGGACLAPRSSLWCARLQHGVAIGLPTCSTALECQAGEIRTTLPRAGATAQKYCQAHCSSDADCPIDYACDPGSRSCVTSAATCNVSICPGPFYECNGGGPYTCDGQSCTSDGDCGTDGGAATSGVCVQQRCAGSAGTCMIL